MEPSYRQMLQRYKSLIYKEVEIADQYKSLAFSRAQVRSESEGARIYLQTGFHDPAVKREFQKIAELKKQLTSPTNRAQKLTRVKLAPVSDRSNTTGKVVSILTRKSVSYPSFNPKLIVII